MVSAVDAAHLEAPGRLYPDREEVLITQITNLCDLFEEENKLTIFLFLLIVPGRLIGEGSCFGR